MLAWQGIGYLPVYNRGEMLTWLFTKVGNTMEIKMILMLLQGLNCENSCAELHTLLTAEYNWLYMSGGQPQRYLRRQDS